MKTTIKATGVTLSEDDRSYLEKKMQLIEKFVPKHDASAELNAEISLVTGHHRSGNVYATEFLLHLAGEEMYASAEAGEIRTAIDLAKDALVAKLKAVRGKRFALFRRGSKAIKDMVRGWRRGKGAI